MKPSLTCWRWSLMLTVAGPVCAAPAGFEYPQMAPKMLQDKP